MKFTTKSMIPEDRKRNKNFAVKSRAPTLDESDSDSEVSSRDYDVEASNVCSTTISVKDNKRPIIYKEFQTASEHVTDIYWKDQLILASRNVFSNGITYDGKNLIKKDVGQERVGKKAKTIAKNFIEFHKNYDNAMSESDVKLKEDAKASILDQVLIFSWSESSVKMRNLALFQYALHQKQNTDMSDKSYESLMSAIFWSLGTVDESDVIVENGVIIELDFLSYSKDNDMWYHKYTPGNGGIAKTKAKSKVKNIKNIEEMWLDFIKTHTALIEHEEKLKEDKKASKKKRKVKTQQDT